jgi:hypothetical protein
MGVKLRRTSHSGSPAAGVLGRSEIQATLDGYVPWKMTVEPEATDEDGSWRG